MSSVSLRVHYATRWGENLFLERVIPGPDGQDPERQLLPMRYEGGGFWSLEIGLIAAGSLLEYRYEFHGLNPEWRREPASRRLKVAEGIQVVQDYWLAPELPDGAFLRQAFAGVIFNPARTAVPPVEPSKRRRFRITLRCPRVMTGHRLCVSGAHPMLGQWQPEQARVMSGENYPLWELDLPADDFAGPGEFKIGLWDDQRRSLVSFEEGANRRFDDVPHNVDVAVLNCEHYGHARPWRGAGVAIPVFSLRGKRGFGVGEFLDLALFAEWAAKCKLHLVQLLPVNDTSSDFTWKDSYPYKAISTSALHPIYLNIERVHQDSGEPVPPDYAEKREALNRLAQLDYERVLNEKLKYLRTLFARVGRKAVADQEFGVYLREQTHWLLPYAAFCHLRDLHGTAEFSRWGEDARYPAEKVRSWFKPVAPEYETVMFHCWVQFHLDRQLREALSAGHSHAVAFKGDLPIGIDRDSVEAWIEPELFRMDRQTGAPPDAFAVLGQNWGFPTYNWARMEADGFAWWRRRFHRMAEVFDALRIDHILGFFRIWEIPRQYREGITGHYNPALPLTRNEIRQAGFGRDPAKYATETAGELEFEVLFLEDPDRPGRFHPRINLASTALYHALQPPEQKALRQLHDDFFYRRHTGFWAAEAMKKLPVLMDASQMLICGEDLGMVPDSVPIVLKRLGLLSLEVQRWPKQLGRRFGEPAEYPYLSVCTTSTHDMSTIRGWWEEESEARQHFYGEVMRRAGPAPAKCTPELCRFIITQNLDSPSMWCIVPLQDWLGLDPELRHPVAAEERINVPAIPRHYWRYRMHLTIEALLEAGQFNGTVQELVEASGRSVGD